MGKPFLEGVGNDGPGVISRLGRSRSQSERSAPGGLLHTFEFNIPQPLEDIDHVGSVTALLSPRTGDRGQEGGARERGGGLRGYSVPEPEWDVWGRVWD